MDEERLNEHHSDAPEKHKERAEDGDEESKSTSIGETETLLPHQLNHDEDCQNDSRNVDKTDDSFTKRTDVPNSESRHAAAGSMYQNGNISKDYADEGTPYSSPDATASVSKFSFSTTRVWIAIVLIIVCYIVTFISLAPICTQYFTYRIARDNFNVTINSTDSKSKCVNSTHEEEDFMNKVQKQASNTLLYATIASGVPAFFTCLFIGSYSDYLGRKPLLICSVSGGLVRIIILLLIIKLDIDIQFYYIGAVVDGMAGTYFVCTLATTAVVADITPEPQNRAFRFAIIEGILFVSGALSQLGIGYLIEDVGYFIPVLIVTGILCLALILIIFFLPETMPGPKHSFQWNIGVHVKKTFGFYFLDGTTFRRIQYAIGLGIFFFLNLTNLGRLTVEMLFVLNAPICWNSMDIGIYNSIRLVVMSLVAVAVLGICKRRLSLEFTGMICASSAVAGFIVEGFAQSTAFMYLSGLVGILYFATIPIPRALLSQITSPHRQGALFSSLSCMETVASMVSSTVYTLIYNATLDTFKGSVFMVMSAMCFLTFILLGGFRGVRHIQPVGFEYVVKDPEGAGTAKNENRDQASHETSLDETSPLLPAKV